MGSKKNEDEQFLEALKSEPGKRAISETRFRIIQQTVKRDTGYKGISWVGTDKDD